MPLTGKDLKIFAEKVPDDAVLEHEVDDEFLELESSEIRYQATAEDVIAASAEEEA